MFRQVVKMLIFFPLYREGHEEGNILALIDYYRTELKRIAWRQHYYIKKQQNNEMLSSYEPVLASEGFADGLETSLMIEQMLESLSSPIGKEVIYRIYILQRPEKIVAQELQLSQQAVNRWKNKMLKELKLKMSSLNT